MSNLNDFVFSNRLEQFKKLVLDPQIKRTEKARGIMSDANYKWDSDKQKETAQARLKEYERQLAFYQTLYDEGVQFCTQHENITNKLVKWYEKWWNDISDDGLQMKEMMQIQADWLNEIFSEIFSEIKDLNITVESPRALNLK